MFEQLYTILEKLSEKLTGWLENGVLMLPNVLVAAIVFLLILFFSKIVKNLISKALEKVSKNKSINDFILSLIQILIYVYGVFVCLGILHLDSTVTSLLAGLGIIGLAISFAFQHTAANIISGVIMSLRTKIEVGDVIETNGVFGYVRRIGFKSMSIDNTQGQMVEVPNRLVMDGSYKLYSTSGGRRIDLRATMSPNKNLKEIQKIIVAELSKLEILDSEKPIQFYWEKFTLNGVQFFLRTWIKFKNVDPEYLNARSEVIIRVTEILKENGISLTTNLITVEGLKTESN